MNTSRGQIHDSAALEDAIRNKDLRVALDVYEQEPGSGDADFEDTDLAAMITCTPHIGASTNQASEAIAAEAVKVVRTFVETGKPVNAVNIREKSEGPVSLVVRHYNKVGVLASVLSKLKNDGINIEEMENTIYAGNEAAVCTLKLDHEPKPITIEKILDNVHVIKAIIT